MPRQSTISKLAEIGQDQWGLVTRRQAEQAGVSRRTIERLSATGLLERVAHGIYRLSGAPTPDHLALRAAWLQLAPGISAWERTAAEGVVSHRSAAAFYGLGHLAADTHEFTVSTRRQTRRRDVRLHRRKLSEVEYLTVRGIPVTRPSRIASDLLFEKEDPEAVAQVVADAIRGVLDYPGTFADSLARHAIHFGLRRGDGLALLRWLLELVGDRETDRWMDEARAHVAKASHAGQEEQHAAVTGVGG